jgi:hypothetical protein
MGFDGYQNKPISLAAVLAMMGARRMPAPPASLRFAR